ncbi:MAG: YncE family protein, partial [Nitrospiria bacterium]
GVQSVYSPSGNLLSSFNVGLDNTTAVFSKNGKTAFITNEYGNDIKAINTKTYQVKYTINNVGSIANASIPNVYINNGVGYALYHNEIVLFNPKDGMIENNIIPTNSQNLRGLSFSKNGNIAVTVDDVLNQLDVINLKKDKVTKTISFGNMPRDVILKGKNAFAVNYLGNSVSEINIKTGNISTIPVGENPRHIIGCGGNLCVSNNNSNSVSVINPKTFTVVDTISTGKTPFGMTMSKGKLLVAAQGFNQVQKFTLKDNCVMTASKHRSNNHGGMNVDVFFTVELFKF